MEKKTYRTLIKAAHPVYGGNEFIIGVIVGILSVTTGDSRLGLIEVDMETGNHIIPVYATFTDYMVAVGLIEKRYPGLCAFDLKDDELEKI